MARKAASSPSSKSGGESQFDASMRIVVMHGAERFLIQEYTKQLIETLTAKFGDLERFNFDGESASPAAVLDELRSYGLMQRHKLVIVDNADVFLAGGVKPDDEEEAEKKSGPSVQRKLLEKYAEKPVEDATLLLRANTWRPGNIDKLIKKAGGHIVTCEEVTAAKAVNWCRGRVQRRYDTTIDEDAAALLVERHGTSLQGLDVELMKLSVMAGPNQPITRELVNANTILSKDEKAWVIQDAIATAEPAVMLRKLHELVEVSRHDAVPLTWSACDLMRKVHAASRLIRQGVPPNSLYGQLRMFGGSAQVVLAWGKQLEPAQAAQLLQAAIDADRHSKSGFGEPVRNLEALMITIADSVHSDN